MTAANPLLDQLRALPELLEILDDLNVKYVTIAANGTWSFEKLGRIRPGGTSIAQETVREIGALVPDGRPLRHGEWAFRRYDGVSGASLLIERLPVAIADRLPQDILATLKKQVRHTGNGVILGQPGCGKAALLLWLALQIPDEPVLYVSENPPSEFPGSHIVHVFPPTNAGERRSLERFVRLSPTVMWDRIASHEDLLTLFGFPGARRRWFTLDAATVPSGLRVLAGAVQFGCDASVSTLLALATSVIGRPEARNLAVREARGWQEPFRAEDSCLDLIAAFEARDLHRLTALEPATLPPVAEASIEALKDVAMAQEARPAPGRLTAPDLGPSTMEDHPITVPVELDDDVVEEGAQEEQQQDDAITGMLAREEMRELREQGILPDERPPRARIGNRHGMSGGVPEVTRAYLHTPSEIGIPETTASIIHSMMPSINGEEEAPPPAVDLANLRITTAGEVDEEQLFVPEEQDGSEGDDYSGVFDGDLDLESLAEEMLSEISEVDPPGVVADEDLMPFGNTNPEHQIYLSEDDLEPLDDSFDDSSDDTRTARGDIVLLAQEMKKQVAAEEEAESTREFTLNERLLMLRQRRTEDE